MYKLIVFALSVIIAGVSLSAKEVSVLTIGNSFADSAFVFLPKVTESAGDKIIMDRANIGGCSLERHWQSVVKSEADPEFKPYYKKFTLKDKLEARKWDFVTIQQASHFSWKAETYEPYAKNLQEYVKKYVPEAELVIQQTWAYRFDDKRLGGWKIDQQEMYKNLTEAYDKAAAELKIRVIPTGDAVQTARQTQKTPYVPYDPQVLKDIKHPDALPSEAGSFVMGLKWRKDKEGNWKVAQDSFHLNNRGRYLQACVWYGFFFEKPTSEIKFVPEDITAEDAAFLREVAQKALDARKK